jgi:hypothetical protein
LGPGVFLLKASARPLGKAEAEQVALSPGALSMEAQLSGGWLMFSLLLWYTWLTARAGDFVWYFLRFKTPYVYSFSELRM